MLDGGRVVAFAPEAELLETCDIYRDVHEVQTRVGASADFDRLEGLAYDPLSQRNDPAFADELSR